MAPLTFIQGRVGFFLSHLLRASLSAVEHKLQKLGPLLPSALWPLFPEVHLDLVSTYISVWMNKKGMYPSMDEGSWGRSRLDRGGQIRVRNDYILMWSQRKDWPRRRQAEWGELPTWVSSWYLRSVLWSRQLEKVNISLAFHITGWIQFKWVSLFPHVAWLKNL